jgi:hypothetical protein
MTPAVAPPPAPTPTATEIVTRPDPGIARGKWEAPVWVFWVLLAAVVLGATAYMLRRLGVLQLGNKQGPAGGPPSSDMRKRRP